MTPSQIQKAALNMVAYGGSFMKHLGNALLVADQENTIKILSNWEDEIKQYLKYEL
jgi:hypothetical protein